MMLNFAKKCKISGKKRIFGEFFFAKQIIMINFLKKVIRFTFFSKNGMQKLRNFCFSQNFPGILCINIHMNLHRLQIEITYSKTFHDTFSVLPICCSICVSSCKCEPTSFRFLFWVLTGSWIVLQHAILERQQNIS